jgi:pimeloyl-ACP methyl ester carboxylesterase
MKREDGCDVAGWGSPVRGRGFYVLIAMGCLLSASAWAQLPSKPPFTQPPGQPPATQPPKTPAAAQPPAQKPPVKPRTPSTRSKPEEDKPPEPVSMTLDTKDGWRIHCEYYGPQEKIRQGKETVPIIMVHGWEGQGSDWNFLAVGLQTLGHASMVIDLRGHGRSTTRRVPRDTTGATKTVTVDDLDRDDISRIWLDLEAAKSELMKKHHAGEVNIEMLTVIAAEVGCIIAMEWAVRDWAWPITPAYKQGQDVKALVLLSPVESYRRMSASKSLNHPTIQKSLSLMFAVGAEDTRLAASVKRMHDRIERVRPPLDKLDPKEAERLRDLFLIQAPTSLQGTALTDRSLPVNRAIVYFLTKRLLERSDELRWSERKSPVGG